MQNPADQPDSTSRHPGWRKLPSAIWALGIGSLFMDTSSELINSLLPLFMVSTLGASMITVGIVEGTAEATAAIMKVFSGVLSDYIGKRKFLMVLGYAIAALTKPVFPLAKSVGWVFMGRFIDRMGKGIRGAPRDALIADITPAHLRGTAYGLRQALDSVGAVAGPSLALAFMISLNNDIRLAMWIATLPAFICVILLIVVVREPERSISDVAIRPSLKLTDVKRLPMEYWLIVALGAIFTLARFSEAFLVLRAQDVGFELGLAPLVLIVMNVFYAGAAYPAGAISDRLNHRTLLFVALLLLIGADIAFASAPSPGLIFVGAGLWGLHLAFSQGLLSKLVADTAPAELRGTAFGIFNLVSGMALLLASVIAGYLWRFTGPAATFLVGAAFAGTAAIGVLFISTKDNSSDST